MASSTCKCKIISFFCELRIKYIDDVFVKYLCIHISQIEWPIFHLFFYEREKRFIDIDHRKSIYVYLRILMVISIIEFASSFAYIRRIFLSPLSINLEVNHFFILKFKNCYFIHKDVCYILVKCYLLLRDPIRSLLIIFREKISCILEKGEKVNWTHDYVKLLISHVTFIV